MLSVILTFRTLTTSLGSKSLKMDPGINPNSVVKLNVGGTIFQTTQATLLSDQNSMLAKMFSTEKNGRIPAIQDDSGAYFIDRCPKYFGIILNFLRGGVVEKGANVDVTLLRAEAEYFCIEGLVKVIDEEIEKTEKEASKSLNQFSNLENELRVIQDEIKNSRSYTIAAASALNRSKQAMTLDWFINKVQEIKLKIPCEVLGIKK